VITIINCTKSFLGRKGIIQRNAIKSWTLLQPKPEIILIRDKEGIAGICTEFDLIHIPKVEKEFGTPLVNSINWPECGRLVHKMRTVKSSLSSGFRH
jgi:hypothetical protein